MQHRNGLVVGDGHVGVQPGPAGLLRGFAFQLDLALFGGVRLGFQLARQDLVVALIAVRCPPELLPRLRVGLLVHRQIRIPLDGLAVGEPERFGALAEPAARRLALLRGVQVVPARARVQHYAPRSLRPRSANGQTKHRQQLARHRDSIKNHANEDH